MSKVVDTEDNYYWESDEWKQVANYEEQLRKKQIKIKRRIMDGLEEYKLWRSENEFNTDCN